MAEFATSSFKKTTITVEVISDASWQFAGLGDVVEAITTGECSGLVVNQQEESICPLDVDAALKAHGSDVDFILGEGGMSKVFLLKLIKGMNDLCYSITGYRDGEGEEHTETCKLKIVDAVFAEQEAWIHFSKAGCVDLEEGSGQVQIMSEYDGIEMVTEYTTGNQFERDLQTVLQALEESN